MSQLTLFDTPALPRAAPAPAKPVPAATPPAPAAAAPAPAPKRSRKGSAPVAPAVVIDAPLVPPLGAVAKIDGRWHVWRRDPCATVQGWSAIKPDCHAAHASDTPPRLGSNGWIAEPFPKPAEVEIDGLALRIEWSEYGFGVYDGEHFVRHFSEVAADADDAKRIVAAFLAEQAAADGEGEDDDPEPEPQTPLEEADDDQAEDLAPAAPPSAKGEPPPLDPLLQQLLDAKLINNYALMFGYHQTDPRHAERDAPWNEPSRKFQFPCTVMAADKERPVRLLVNDPLLVDHPYVRELAEASGLEPQLAEGDDAHRCGAMSNGYHHAVDLIGAGQWRRLLELREFTDDDALLCAVSVGLRHGNINTRDAQAFLKAIGAGMPSDPSPLDALRGVDLTEFEHEKKRVRAVNFLRGPGELANVWGLIAGMERGWFIFDKSKHLTWTDKAMSEQQNMRLAEAMEPRPDPVGAWRFEWRGLTVIGRPGPCFEIDRQRHPPGTPCWSETGFRSFCGSAWSLAGESEGRSDAEWSVAILDAFLAAPAKDGNGLGGQLVEWWPLGVHKDKLQGQQQGALL